jgi:hypothetical protein
MKEPILVTGRIAFLGKGWKPAATCDRLGDAHR